MLRNFLLLCSFYFISGKLCAAVIEDEYIIHSDILPDDVRFRPTLGNGHIASNVYSDSVYMNGLYNGFDDRSSRARLPAYVTFDVNVTDGDIIKQAFTLDMYNGVFTKTVKTSTFNLTITSYAHRSIYRLFVTQLDIMRHGLYGHEIKVNISGDKYWKESNDLSLEKMQADPDVIRLKGQIKEPEIRGMGSRKVFIIHTVVPDTVTLPADQESSSRSFLASYGYNLIDVESSFTHALNIKEQLLSSHKQSWNDIWKYGEIVVNGNNDLSTDIAAATYYVLCSVPSEANPNIPFYGVSPGGLSRGGLLHPDKPGGPKNDYAGHVFWDMDTWVMPPMLIFRPNMARRMIEARTRVLHEAKNNARNEGLKGAKFPWEQASTGIETTPRWAGNMSLYEIHVTADVSYGLRQYLYATDDDTILKQDNGFEMAIEIARFWSSRVSKKNKNSFEILGVMGPDEYHSNVNNSVFTNFNARLSLLLPSYIKQRYDITINETLAKELKEFEVTANKIIILFDKELQYHPQYEHFNSTVSIKQSDVVLLGYPLMMDMSKDVRRNDLEIYEKITDKYGPDTGTWSMHTVGWLELGKEERAYENFRKMFRNINEPFKVFSEKPVTNDSYGGCVNFITGAGGFLQSIVFGYGGLRLHQDKLEINPSLLPNTTSWGLKGIKYKGSSLNIDINKTHFSISAVLLPVDSSFVISGSNAGYKTVRLNYPMVFKRQAVYVSVEDVSDKTNFADSNNPHKFAYLCVLIIVSAFHVFFTIL